MHSLCLYEDPVITKVYDIMQERQTQMNYGWCSDISLLCMYDMYVW